MQLIIVVLLAVVAGSYWHSTQTLATDSRRLFRRALAVVGGLMLLALVMTGRLHLLAALGVVMLILARQLPLLLKRWPVLRRLRAFLGKSAGADCAETDQKRPSRHKSYTGAMSLAEARRILEVDARADEAAIVRAHRRLMQRVHPDRGGTDDLASRANEAKARLLWEL